MAAYDETHRNDRAWEVFDALSRRQQELNDNLCRRYSDECPKCRRRCFKHRAPGPSPVLQTRWRQPACGSQRLTSWLAHPWLPLAQYACILKHHGFPSISLIFLLLSFFSFFLLPRREFSAADNFLARRRDRSPPLAPQCAGNGGAGAEAGGGGGLQGLQEGEEGQRRLRGPHGPAGHRAPRHAQAAR